MIRERSILMRVRSLKTGLSALFCLGWVLSVLAQEKVSIGVDGYAARVNDRVITYGDVLSGIPPATLQNASPQAREELLEEVRDRLVGDALILEEFETIEEATIPEPMIDDRLNRLVWSRFNDDQQLFMEALKERRMSLAEFRDEIRDTLIVESMMREEVARRVHVTPSQVRRTYQDQIDSFTEPPMVRFRMIILQKGETAEEAEIKRDEAERILGRLEAGDEFAEVAEEVSEGNRAREGGLWDWIEPGSLRSELAEVLPALAVGAVSPVVETEDSLYILKLEGRKAEQVTAFEEVREEIRDRLETERRAGVLEAYLERLKRKHYVELF